MNKFLIGLSEEFLKIRIVLAITEKEAIKKYINAIDPDEDFIEYLHDWCTSFGFSSEFHYDEESKGQKDITEKEVKKRIENYFSEKPEFIPIYISHWNNEVKGDFEKNQMAKFPEKMIRWIWIKELKNEKMEKFRII